jgi:hypothetical protein
MAKGPITLYQQGFITFEGEADPAPGGGSSPQQENQSVIPFLIADLATEPCSFLSVGGAALLDYTDPTNPLVLADGLYLFIFWAICTSGAQLSGTWEIGGALQGTDLITGGGATGQLTDTAQLGAASQPFLSFSISCPLRAGDGFKAHIINSSGLGGSLEFSASSSLTKF